MLINEFGKNVYSQFGEDGIIAHIFSRIGYGNKIAVEFGANDAISCSNTATLWKNENWHAFLIEADELNYLQALINTEGYDCDVENITVAVKGSYQIDNLLAWKYMKEVDFMSIDIDGDDWHIWNGMEARPRVICIEYNMSIPPHLFAVQQEGGNFGASSKALEYLAWSKGYFLVGMTEGNMFFVQNEYAKYFSDYDKDRHSFQTADKLTYVITDFQGRPAMIGADPPWGITDSFLVDPVEADTAIRYPLKNPDPIAKTYLDTLGGSDCAYLTPDNWENIGYDVTLPQQRVTDALTRLLKSKRSVLCFSIDHISPDVDLTWVEKLAYDHGYSCRRFEDILLVLTRSDDDEGGSSWAG